MQGRGIGPYSCFLFSGVNHQAIQASPKKDAKTKNPASTIVVVSHKKNEPLPMIAATMAQSVTATNNVDKLNRSQRRLGAGVIMLAV